MKFAQSCLTLSNLVDSTWDSPGQNTGVGSRSLLQGIIPTQRSNPGLPDCKRILYQLSYQGSPELKWLCLFTWLEDSCSQASTEEKFFTLVGMSKLSSTLSWSTWFKRVCPGGSLLCNFSFILENEAGTSLYLGKRFFFFLQIKSQIAFL